MDRFARAAQPLGEELGWPSFVWLAGLLEGEGTFLKPAPSDPRYPIVSCRMTDRDVIERVAQAFDTSIQANDKGVYKTEFATTIRGLPAVDLMADLRPLMSARRRAAIDRALEGYSAPAYKLSFIAAEEIRRRRADGETVSSLARCFGVARQTIHPILDRRNYREPIERHWRGPSTQIRGAVAAGTGLSWAELYWLAGWLEGEGSFVKPPPSNPKAPRVLATTCDEDVIREVQRLLRVKPTIDRRGRERNWAPVWRLILRGGRAITLMEAIAPVMSARRQRQIAKAVAGAALGWPERYSYLNTRTAGR